MCVVVDWIRLILDKYVINIGLNAKILKMLLTYCHKQAKHYSE
jgi:hypothetical protein